MSKKYMYKKSWYNQKYDMVRIEKSLYISVIITLVLSLKHKAKLQIHKDISNSYH